MGRTVVAEETVEDYVSSLYGVRKWQIGLVVGQVSRLVYNTIMKISCDDSLFKFRHFRVVLFHWRTIHNSSPTSIPSISLTFHFFKFRNQHERGF